MRPSGSNGHDAAVFTQSKEARDFAVLFHDEEDEVTSENKQVAQPKSSSRRQLDVAVDVPAPTPNLPPKLKADDLQAVRKADQLESRKTVLRYLVERQKKGPK